MSPHKGLCFCWSHPTPAACGARLLWAHFLGVGPLCDHLSLHLSLCLSSSLFPFLISLCFPTITLPSPCMCVYLHIHIHIKTVVLHV